MKTLKLTLKKQWFDLIKSGVKLEEYREIKPYWIRRLLCDFNFNRACWNIKLNNGSYRDIKFDQVQFTNGYSANSPRITVECKGIHIETGRKEWGAVEGVNYFVIELGDVLTNNEVETKQI